LLALHRGAFLHDIGKVGVPDSILFKPGRLSPQEWEVMRQHPIKGEAICRPVKSLAPVLPIIRSHHERWNGTGYPDGLAGENIPLLARILQIADIYDALTSPRPYKRAVPGPRALEILEQEAQRGWREPRLVRVFREVWEASLWPTQLAALAQAQPAPLTSEAADKVPATALK
jgi:putative two-component system response regulator